MREVQQQEPQIQEELQEEFQEKQIIEITEEEIKNKKATIEQVFNRIYHENMKDVPVINEKLEVTVVGLQQWQDFYLGVLITPWFMNIIILPYQIDMWDDLSELSKETYIFPSGRYSFITGRDKELATYQMCSLFSPMFEFADNVAALDTATVVIKELMNVENIEQNDIDSEQIERIWKGEEEHPGYDDDNDETSKKDSDDEEVQDKSEPTPIKDIKENIQTPMSRRDMLRGAFLRKGDGKND